MNKRILSLLLVFAMCFSMLPVQALAAEDGGVDSPSENEAVTTEADESTTPTTDVVEEEDEAEEQPAFDFDTASDEEVKAYLSNLDDEAYAAFVESMTDEQFDRLAEIFASDYGTNVNVEEGEEKPVVAKIGETGYSSLSAAAEAAAAGDTIVLMAASAETFTLPVGVTFNPSTCAFTGDVLPEDGNFIVVYKNGTFKAVDELRVNQQVSATDKHMTSDKIAVLTAPNGTNYYFNAVAWTLGGGEDVNSINCAIKFASRYDGQSTVDVYQYISDSGPARIEVPAGSDICLNLHTTFRANGDYGKPAVYNSGNLVVYNAQNLSYLHSGTKAIENSSSAKVIIASASKTMLGINGGTIILGGEGEDVIVSSLISNSKITIKEGAIVKSTANFNKSTLYLEGGTYAIKPEGNFCNSSKSSLNAGCEIVKVSDKEWKVIKTVAKIGDMAYASLAEAAAAAQTDETVMLMADCEEDIILPAGVTFNTNGKSYNGNVSAPEGYRAVNNDGVYNVEKIPVVAAIGGTEYETLAEAVKAAKSGETIVLMSDCGEDITLPVGVTFDVRSASYTGNVSVPEGCKFDGNGEDGVYYVVAIPVVAMIGNEKYETFAEAFEAAQDGDTVVATGYDDSWNGFPLPSYTIKEGVTFKTNGFDFYANELVINGTLKNECVEDEDGANNESILRVNSIVVNGRLVNNGIVDTSSLTVAANGTYENNGTGMMTDTAVVEGSFVNQEKSILGTADGNNTIVTIKGNGTLTNFADDVFFATVQDEKGNALTPDENGVYKLTAPAVAKIGDTEYDSLEKALAAVKPGEEILMISSDGAGQVLTVPTETTLTIENCTFNGQLIVNGTLNLNNGIVEYSNNSGSLQHVITLKNCGVMNFNGGSVIGLSMDGTSAETRGIQVTSANAVLNVQNGSVVASNYPLMVGKSVMNDASICLKGGTFTSMTAKSAQGVMYNWSARYVPEGYYKATTAAEKGYTVAITNEGAVALDVDTNSGYATAAEALKNASNVKLLKDTAETVNVNDGKTLTIPEGVTLTGCVKLKGTLNVYGSIVNNTPNANGQARAVEMTTGTPKLYVHSGTITGYDYAVLIGNDLSKAGGAVVEIYGGTFYAKKDSKLFYNWKDEYKKSSICSIGSDENNVIWQFSAEAVEDNAVAMTADGFRYCTVAEAIQKSSEVTVFGVCSENIILSSPIKLTLTKDAVLNGTLTVDNANAEVAVNGEINGRVVVRAGNVVMNSGASISYTNTGDSAAAVVSLNGGSFTMNGGQITGEKSGKGETRGIHVNEESAALTINGGKVIGSDYAVVLASKLANVETVNVQITAGELTAKTGSRVFLNWRESFKAAQYCYIAADDNGIHWNYCDSTPENAVVVTESGYVYSKIADAFSKEAAVTLLGEANENVTVKDAACFTIAQGGVLNGSLTVDNAEAKVTVNGGIVGKVTIKAGEVVLNDGAEIRFTNNSSTVAAAVNLNGGSFIMNGGTIAAVKGEGEKEARGIHVNTEDSTLRISGGVVTGTEYAVVLASALSDKDGLNVQISGGELIANAGSKLFLNWKDSFKAAAYCQVYTAGEQNHWAFGNDVPENAVAVTKSGYVYSTIAEALNKQNEVTLLGQTNENVNLNTEAKVIIDEKAVLNGNVSVNHDDAKVELNGQVNGKVTVKLGCVVMGSNAAIVFHNTSGLTAAAVNLNGGSFEMKGGLISATNNGSGDTRGIHVNNADAMLMIDGGTITAQHYAIMRAKAAAIPAGQDVNILISGGDFSSEIQNTVISGWDERYLSGDNITMFKSMKHWMVRAPLTLTVEGTKNFEVSPSMGKDDKGNNKLGYAEKITVTETSENANGYWLNKTTGFKISDSTYCSFTAMDDVTLVWVAVNPDEKVATFITGSNQVLGVFTAKDLTELTELPAVPYKSGYTGVWKIEGTGEEATVEAIKAALVNGPVKVMPYYTVEESQEDVKVYQVIANRKYADVITQLSNDQFAYGSYVKFHVSDSVTAKDTEYFFSHWSADENGKSVVSKDPDFNLKVLKDITLYAIYVENNQAVITIREPIQTITCSAIEKNVNGVNKHIFTATSKRVLPDNAVVAEAGIEYSRDGITWYKSEYTIGQNGYTLNVTTSTKITKVYFRDYVVLKQKERNEDEEFIDVLVTYRTPEATAEIG